MLPLREIVLYKNGVGYFVREGAVSGEAATLVFPQEAVNDILKSLAIFDKAGGQVLGIHYQTPADKSSLPSTSVSLSEASSLRDLIRDLRGRRVSLAVEVAGHMQKIEGRVVGLDESQVSTLMIFAESGELMLFKISDLRSLRIHDEQSERDLRDLLNNSMIEERRRTINVQLSPGEHDLTVTYTAPSSTWRVSYRLVAEGKADGLGGKALLQGWGLFDNRLDEDLAGVKVTLVVGQPISFVYDLYGSRVPQRAQVADKPYLAQGPVEYDELSVPMAQAAPVMRAAGKSRGSFGAALQAVGGLAAAPAAFFSPRQQAAESFQVQAQGEASGEFFQYAITTPVSVKQGSSALVPILSVELDYERELLYNQAKTPDHPVAALRFKNTFGLTLEHGPVTVVEDDVYKGEAIVPQTREGSEIYLPYAVESGVKVDERQEYWYVAVGFRVVRWALIYERFHVRKVTYTLENVTAKPMTVLIEAPIQTSYELFETPEPAQQTLKDRRWRVEVPAKSKVEFVRKERMRYLRRIIGFPNKTTLRG